jgi:negative regulator of flagellin synthesis FlgM
MEIKKVNGYEGQAVQKTAEQQQARRVSEEGTSGREISSGSDQVKLSSHYQEMARVRKVMMDREDLRTERVDHLRNMLEENKYVVNPEGIAQKMLEELW